MRCIAGHAGAENGRHYRLPFDSGGFPQSGVPRSILQMGVYRNLLVSDARGRCRRREETAGPAQIKNRTEGAITNSDINANAGKSITTGTLLRRLFRTSSFDKFKENYASELKTPELSDYISALCAERGEKHERIIKRAGLDRVYGHQIFCGIKHPTRDKVIQLAFGFEMNDKQAQDLLKIARKSPLYPRAERDAAILYCLHNKVSFVETQLMLAELRLPILGGETGRE